MKIPIILHLNSSSVIRVLFRPELKWKFKKFQHQWTRIGLMNFQMVDCCFLWPYNRDDLSDTRAHTIAPNVLPPRHYADHLLVQFKNDRSFTSIDEIPVDSKGMKARERPPGQDIRVDGPVYTRVSACVLSILGTFLLEHCSNRLFQANDSNIRSIYDRSISLSRNYSRKVIGWDFFRDTLHWIYKKSEDVRDLSSARMNSLDTSN